LAAWKTLSLLVLLISDDSLSVSVTPSMPLIELPRNF